MNTEKVYTNSENVKIPVSVSDDYFDRTDVFANGIKRQILFEKKDTAKLNLEEGNYKISATAYDKAGNPSVKEKEIVVDKTAPQFSIIKPADTITADKNFELKIDCTESNLEKIVYSVNGSSENIISGNSDYMDLEQGKNKIVATAYDKAGNISKDSLDMYYDSTSTSISEIIPKKFDVKVYPNPAIDYSNVNVETEKSEDISIKVYDSSGKILKKSNEKCSGECDYSIDISKFSKGIYFFDVSTSDGKRTLKKIVKQ